MAPVPLKSIVSVTSEDNLNPATNLLSPGRGGKWLCAEGNRSRTAEVVVELSKRVRINSLEICNFGSAFVEILVSNSSNPEEELTLLHMAMLMSANESRMGRNKNKLVMYPKDKLSASAAAKKWNRIKIRCVQKYNQDVQFGLRALAIFTDSHDSSSTSGMPLDVRTAAASTTDPRANSVSTPKQGTPSRRDHYQSAHKYPSLPASEYQTSQVPSKGETSKSLKRNTQTCKRPKESEEGLFEDFEFSGVEKQSRLFHDCMKGKVKDSDDKAAANRILERIAAEREKYSPSYQRKKLLRRELPKAEVMRDFIESYKKREQSAELNGASRKLSAHDNSYEIGEEPEKTWGWGKGWSGSKKKSRTKSGSGGVRRKRGHSTSSDGNLLGWLNKRKKVDNLDRMMEDLLAKAGAVGESGYPELGGCNSELANRELCELSEGEYDSSDEGKALNVTAATEGKGIAITSGEVPAELPGGASLPEASSSLVECPLCQSFFPCYAIDVHASQCMSPHPSNNHTLGDVLITID